MAINKAIYKQMNNDNSFDEIHFKTDASMVDVLDGQKQSKGNLEDLILKGQNVESGSILNIKLSGKYSILGLTDMPSGTSATKRYALQVIGIGENINNPTLINYVLYDEDGYIYYRTITQGGKDSGWSSGGTGIQNIVNGIINSIGKVDNLSTVSKTLVGAINELNNFRSNAEGELADLGNKDFDAWYIRRDKPSEVTANMELQFGKGINVKYTDGSLTNLIGSDLSGNVHIGDTKGSINLKSNGQITHNGSKIWTESNDGVNSGLDADYLGGVHHSRYLKTDSNGRFENTIKFDKGLNLADGEKITWDNGAQMFSGSSNGDLIINNKSGSNIAIVSQNGISSNRLSLSSKHGLLSEISLSTNIPSQNFKFTVNGAGNFSMYNSNNNTVMMESPRMNQYLNFPNGIGIDGKRLFVQSTTPTGSSFPVGSLWFKTSV